MEDKKKMSIENILNFFYSIRNNYHTYLLAYQIGEKSKTKPSDLKFHAGIMAEMTLDSIMKQLEDLIGTDEETKLYKEFRDRFLKDYPNKY